MLYDYTVGRPRTRFFSKEVNFNNFSNITTETIDEVKQKLQVFLKNIDSDNLNYFERYERVYDFLGSPVVFKTLQSFDEQILFLIFALDPDLLYLKAFKESDIIPLKRIEEADKKDRKDLEAKRSEQHHKYTGYIRDTLGIYDSKLLRYESLYFEHLIKPDMYATSIKGDAVTPLLHYAFIVQSFTKLSDERFEELKAIARDYNESVANANDIHLLAYNMLSRRKCFKNLTIKERYALFIFMIDPELKMLKIYEEESKIDEISRRCIEEFGYFDIELIRLEKIYHQRFCPDKKISIWSSERKLLWKKD